MLIKKSAVQKLGKVRCVLNVAGRPVRHVRLDCRVALVDENREREFVPLKTEALTRNKLETEAPWFL